jgi:hypothetical protein
MAIPTALTSPEGEGRLRAFGLSTELIHMALRPGLSRAANRTSKALRSTPGTDIYHDTMEHLHLLLAEMGWSLVHIDHQPRLLHPDARIAVAIASGTNVASWDPRWTPRTRRKGVATRNSLAGPRAEVVALFDVPGVEQDEELVNAARLAPLWLLVHERTVRGLNLELSRPAGMNASGIVTEWADRIIIGFLDLDGDLTVFDNPDDGGFDVPVQPR